MLFQRISYRIALQFTVFVFLLFLINGSLFLAADFQNARRQAVLRSAQTANTVMQRIRVEQNGMTVSVPPMLRDRVRVTDPIGKPIYAGGFFDDIPFEPHEGVHGVRIGDDQYAVFSIPLVRQGNLDGYVQVAELYRLQFGDLPVRSLIYIVVSIAVSAATFAVGLFFARRSLRPAEQAMMRLEQFTQDASHELRTPLAALNSSLDLALKSTQYREGLLSAKDDVKELSQLVQSLLDLARLDGVLLQQEKLNLSFLLEEVVHKYEPQAAEKHVQLTVHAQPNVMVKGDALLLRQMIGNLLHNAMKFMQEDGGSITITLTKQALTIADTGIGMSAEHLQHIFDRFYQVQSSRTNDGFGLGLSFVKRIVDLHHWNIAVQSEEGKGTTFTVSF